MWIYFLYNTVTYLVVSVSRRRAVGVAVFISYVLFVGLRYETGTDWQVYKPNFYALGESYEFSEFWSASVDYGQEPGFLLLNSIFSKIFTEFEYFQCFISIVFVASFYYMSKTFGAKNVPMALAVSSSYLWMNLEFSVLRQSLSIAFFNFGVSFFIRRRPIIGTIFFAAGFLVHFSSAIYIATFAISNLPIKKIYLFFSYVVITILGIVITLSDAVNALLPDMAKSKVDFYYGRSAFARFIDVDNFFILMIFIFGLLLVMRDQRGNHHQSEPTRILGNFIVGLAVVGISATVAPILRDRISYEFVIILAVYVTLPDFYWHKRSRLLLFLWGFLFSLYRVTFAIMLPYEPYQNYLVYSLLEIESSAEDRMRRFLSYQFFNR